ncbi:MAG: site-specific DNA-methyltransferase [Xenococcus sp. (in: cyanobacteria)]
MDVAVQTSLSFNNSDFQFTPFIKNNLSKAIKPCYITCFGALFEGDCQDILPTIKDSSIDTVFADPPFNLNKKYGNKSKDDLTEAEYLNWCYKWIDECIRILKPGGALFIYNLPKWNIMLGAYLINAGLTFRHDIAIDMNNGFPISGRLYPSHYSLLYFTKGKPKTFRKIRTPIEKCRHCDGEIKDYGGHRKSMNPNGVNLKDIWIDIPPVRHKKFKSKSRKANALSTKLLDRVVELTTNPGDIVLDPFGGSGTTYDVCEKKNRHWIGIEIDFADEIVDRLTNKNIQHHNNNDYVEG